MMELKIISLRAYPIRSLVEKALGNESRLLQAGLKQTEQRITNFEEKYKLSSEEFIRQYENDELRETLDFAEWVGEYRLLERLREKLSIPDLSDVPTEIENQ